MASLKTYNFQLQTLSSLVLSPREQHSFYRIAGDFATEAIIADSEEKKEVNIIYPFYQYGSYTKYNPQSAQYYIPGSSMKGALRASGFAPLPTQLMVDDINVDRKDIRLRNLYKVQHAGTDTESSAKIEVFFPNVGVEMLNAGIQYQGVMYCDQDPKEYLLSVKQKTAHTLHQYVEQLNFSMLNMGDTKDRADLQEVKERSEGCLYQLKDDSTSDLTILLGGYKGAILSGLYIDNDGVDHKSAIYFDKQQKLPHGLVQIKWE
ncbi:hypothetical protein [Paenibacillus arenosi]|uniref:CRISPR type III A-associated protein Csm5 n=1 Tax=Paenibacillus arenosi TaxID=2774142 RepID=A0ABR9AZQ3_9BACL|nr:hypothetical protein [Paenibacillus arenosi]MBD8499548.1 hypothetical protein [Paenibacillus arenosi]